MATAIDFASLLAEERRKARQSGKKRETGTDAAESTNISTSDAGTLRAPPPTTPAPPPPATLYCLPTTRGGMPSFDAATHRLHLPCGRGSVWHVPNFLSPEEELRLMQAVDAQPAEAWVRLRGRQLIPLGGMPKPPPELMAPEELPGWAQAVCDRLVATGVFPPDAPPNHILINEYAPGQGIDAHKDGPLYAPHVAIISLGSQCAFEFVEDGVPRVLAASLLLPPRGLLVFGGAAYEELLHTVPARAADDATSARPGYVRMSADAPAPVSGKEPSASLLPRGRRVSLTVRRVTLPPTSPSADVEQN